MQKLANEGDVAREQDANQGQLKTTGAIIKADKKFK